MYKIYTLIKLFYTIQTIYTFLKIRIIYKYLFINIISLFKIEGEIPHILQQPPQTQNNTVTTVCLCKAVQAHLIFICNSRLLSDQQNKSA